MQPGTKRQALCGHFFVTVLGCFFWQGGVVESFFKGGKARDLIPEKHPVPSNARKACKRCYIIFFSISE